MEILAAHVVERRLVLSQASVRAVHEMQQDVRTMRTIIETMQARLSSPFVSASQSRMQPHVSAYLPLISAMWTFDFSTRL